jgi:DNA-binding LacI/PurR family transcriptional regulator
VSDATREKVQAAADKLNFAPLQAAQALASSRSQSIALVIPEPDSLVLGDPFLSLVIRGVSEIVHTTKYQLVLVIVHPDDPPAKVSSAVRPGYVDGAIVVSQHGTGAAAQAIAQTNVPVVYIGRPWTRSAQLYVDVDNWLVGQLATQELLASGATRVACVAGPEDMSPVRDRAAGWVQTLFEAGLTPGPLAHADFTRQGGEDCMRTILEQDREIDAVFAQSDLMAAGAMHVLAEEGLDVPGRIKIIGVDNTELGQSTAPPLSSVTNPADRLANRASQMLLRVIEDGVDPATITPEIIRPELVVRGSG